MSDLLVSIDDDVIPRLRDLTLQASKSVQFAELDYLNARARIVVSGEISNDEKAAIREAATSALSAYSSAATQCPIAIEKPRQQSYVAHMPRVRDAQAPFLRSGGVMAFPVKLEDLLALRDAEDSVYRHACQSHRVAAFALGGTSALIRFSQMEFELRRPRDPRDVPGFADEFARKYNLFPGLNWKSRTEGRDVFISWLQELPRGDRVLLFDTGTKGNGARQILNLLEARVKATRSRCVEEIAILGIVDGSDPAQKDEDAVWDTADGTTRVSLHYVRVPRLFTEDCEILMGYDRNQALGLLLPLRDAALLRILDGEGSCVQVRAGTSASGMYHALMTAPLERPEGSGVALTVDRECAMVRGILNCVATGEYADLDGAWQMGLVDWAQFQSEAKSVFSRYESAGLRYPDGVWSFEEKKFVRIRLEKE